MKTREPERRGIRRLSWPVAFFLLNAVGLVIIIWQVRATGLASNTLRVERISPSGQGCPVDIDRVLVRFRSALDPDTVTADALTLRPTVPGTVQLKGDNELHLRLDRPLRTATRYQVVIAPGLRDLDGRRPTRQPLTFSTPALAVESVAQAGLLPDRACIIAIRFNGPVDPRQLDERLKLTGADGQPVPHHVLGSRAGRLIRVRASSPGSEQLQVRIAAGLTGTEGPRPLAADCLRTVRLSSRLNFLGMDADYNYSDRPIIRVRTSSPVDIAAAARHVATQPPVTCTFDTHYEGFEILGDFKGGERYRVTLKPGLSAGAAGTLGKAITRTVWFPDRPKTVRFAFGSGYLSPNGLLKIPVSSVNMAQARLSVQRLYENNLVEYVVSKAGRQPWSLGSPFIAQDLLIEDRRNEDVETLVDLKALAGEKVRGVFGLRVQDPDRSWRSGSAIAVVTDLGLSARFHPGRALVWVTSITSAKPMPAVKVTVYSDRRQPLGSAQTGPTGLADIALSTSGKLGDPALVVAAGRGELTYLSLERCSRARGPGAAGARPYLTAGYEAFVFPERGVYRAGDLARISAFVRGPEWTTPDPMPLELTVARAGGRDLLKKTVMSDRAGRLVADVNLPPGAQGGVYSATYRIPGSTKPLGVARFRVADYIPHTLRMALDAPPEPLKAAQPLKVTARVQHLFGDPAVGLRTSCRAQYTAAVFQPKGWDGYRFGDARQKARSMRIDADPEAQPLDEQGEATFVLNTPNLSTPAALRAAVVVEVRERGGRTLTESVSRRLHLWPFYLGTRKPQATQRAGQPVRFELAAVAPDGSACTDAKRFKAALFRVTYSNVLRRRGSGRLEYEWTRQEQQVASKEGELAAGRADFDLTPEHDGPYRLLVESQGGCPVTSDFHVGGQADRWAVADPEHLRLWLDLKSYRPGTVARLHIRAPFGGAALVCVETDRVLERRVVDLPTGEGVEEFRVDPSWRPNVYLTATLVRPVQPEDEWRPHRASGVARLDVDCADRQIDLALEAPDTVRPGQEVDVAVRASCAGLPRPGAAVILAAVDEGVLALTAHRTPSPWPFFYGRRRLDVADYDMFSHLAPELARWRVGKPAAPGGGGPEEGEAEPEFLRRLNPIPARRVKTAVWYAGALVTGADGVARTRVRIPEYLGEMRLMAWAADGPAFGSAAAPLPVRSPVMARAAWPRFLAPDDQFELPVTVFNRTAADGPMAVSLSYDGPLQLSADLPIRIDVPAGGERTVRLPLRATGVGKVSARVTASLGPESYGESVELAVRPAVAFARQAGSATVRGPGRTRLRIAAGFLPGTAKTSLVLASSPTVELTGALNYLLQYPYGCVEQTTSRMVPLVYLRDLAELARPGSLGAEEIDGLLRVGFTQLQMMQAGNGGLTMWPGSDRAYPWGSLYAADVLVEAHKAGHPVPPRLLADLLDYIENELKGWAQARDDKGRRTMFGHAAYACYVLARAGRPAYGWMARLEELLRAADSDDKRFSTTARSHLAAAYVAAGRRKLAREFLAAAPPATARRELGSSLASPTREAAVMLSVLLDIDPESKQVPALIHRLKAELRLGRWATTQENAFALMALGKAARRLGAQPVPKASVTLPDGSVQTFDPKKGLQLDTLPPGSELIVNVEGQGTVFAFWHAEGVPKDGKAEEKDAGLRVRRTFLEADGKTAANSAALLQGRLYQVCLTLDADHATDNLVITDLLPAGLEVENPNLRGSADATTGSAPRRLNVQHVERRDDRVLAFARHPGGRAEFRYLARAVTAGTFVLPAAEASCMYDPGLFSLHGRGVVRVKR